MKRKTILRNPVLLLIALLAACSCGNRAGTVNISSEAELPGHTLTTLAGSYYDNKYAHVEGITPFLVNSEADGVQAIRSGAADVMVSDEVIFTREDLEKTGLRKAFTGAEAFPCAMAFKKGETQLRPAFDQFIRIMKENGSLDAHIDYWLNGGEAPSFPEAAKELRDDKPIRYITCLKTAPISFIKDGEWTGLDVELVKGFAAWYGRPLNIISTELTAGILAIQTGQADIISACLFVTEERQKHMDFSEPYYDCHPGFFVLDDAKAAKGGFVSRLKEAFIQSFVTENRWKLIINGLLVTLEITLLAIILGTLLGMIYCKMALSKRKWVRDITSVYNFLMQGIPILVLLLIMFYVVFADTGLSGTIVAIFTFALSFAASSGNVFASSISYVPQGQWEAGYALGFTHGQTFRSIILPQALTKGLAAYEGHCISLLKSTSIVGYIAVQDITRASDLLRSRTFEAFAPLLVITVIYFVLAWLLRLLLKTALPKKRHD